MACDVVLSSVGGMERSRVWCRVWVSRRIACVLEKGGIKIEGVEKGV